MNSTINQPISCFYSGTTKKHDVNEQRGIVSGNTQVLHPRRLNFRPGVIAIRNAEKVAAE